MALTGGIATGIVTWGANEPIIYFGNVWGELTQLGIEPLTSNAAVFALGRTFYHWTFVPYAIYAMCGLLVAYVYYHRKDSLTVTATLKPLFGEKITSTGFSALIDTLAMLALVIGLITGVTMCITLIMSGLQSAYGISNNNIPLYIILGVVIAVAFTFSSYIGMDKGLKVVANVNAWFYYGLLILLFLLGPTVYILRLGTAGLAEWLHNFFRWGLDPKDIAGDAATKSWTLFNWAFWVGYAPVTGIFLAMLSYGRTIREYMIVNWVLPSIFGIIWFSVWGASAINMQIQGTADLVGAINDNGAVFALWEFLKHLPFGIGAVIIPANIIIILISFITNADATLVKLGSMCVRNVPIGTEPPATMKVLWGTLVAIVAIVMAAFGGGTQGVDGVKALAAVAGFLVLFIFVLQIASFVKCFFVNKVLQD
jgi:choline-glycine betaine transporter